MTRKILVLNLKAIKIINEYITNMNDWVDLEIILLKNKTIDKNV
jgi:hypothetical protein